MSITNTFIHEVTIAQFCSPSRCFIITGSNSGRNLFTQ